jgi:hypothetical protein
MRWKFHGKSVSKYDLNNNGQLYIMPFSIYKKQKFQFQGVKRLLPHMWIVDNNRNNHTDTDNSCMMWRRILLITASAFSTL